MGEGFAYGGSTAASGILKKQRVTLVTNYIASVTVVPLTCIHISCLGVIYLAWDPVCIKAVLFSMFVFIWSATTNLIANFQSSDVNIAEKRRPIQE